MIQLDYNTLRFIDQAIKDGQGHAYVTVGDTRYLISITKVEDE